MDIRSLKIGDIVTTNGIPIYLNKGEYYKVVEMDGKASWDDKVFNVHHVGCVILEPIKGENKYSGGSPACFLEPIPITDELLKKIGFKEFKYSFGFESVELNKRSWPYNFCCCVGDIRIQKAIKYLHELQHELLDAGIELEIKL